VRKLRFFQPGQYISIDYGRQDVLVFSVGSAAEATHPFAKTANEWGTQPSVNPQIQMAKPAITAEEPLLAEIKAFLRSVRERSRPVVSLEDGRRALELGLVILAEIANHAGRIGVGKDRNRER
jgi:predicted dehydrogenase